jgi:hypothetical protein
MQETTPKQENEFVAFVGIDWADQKHAWALQTSSGVEHGILGSCAGGHRGLGDRVGIPVRRWAHRSGFGTIARGATVYADQVCTLGAVSGAPHDRSQLPPGLPAIGSKKRPVGCGFDPLSCWYSIVPSYAG